MISRIVSFGCSFTWGTDLPDCSDGNPYGFSQLTWSALVAQKLDKQYYSCALGGSGNLSIADRVFDWVNLNPDDFVMINWTFLDRFDYSDPMGSHFNNGTSDFRTCRPGNDDTISEFYFRHLHSEYRDKLTALMYVKTTIDYLRSKQVRFVMTAIDDLLWCQQWHAPRFVRDLQQEIRPYVHDFEDRNFLAWSRHRGFQISSNNHPLEEAHAAAAELMLPIVQKLIKI